MDKIKFYAYKYAPETARATCNGQPVKIEGTPAPLQICTGKHAEAVKTIKRAARQERNKESRFIYAFMEEGTRKFYYITALSFKASDDIKRRLWAYKELKNHLKKYPPTYTTEAGHVTPEGATKPETTTEAAQIDFTRLLKIKIKEV